MAGLAGPRFRQRPGYRRLTAAFLLHVGILPLIAFELVGLMPPHPPISSLTAACPFGYFRDTPAFDPSVFPLSVREGENKGLLQGHEMTFTPALSRWERQSWTPHHVTDWLRGLYRQPDGW
jgi:hypothetical protein